MNKTYRVDSEIKKLISNTILFDIEDPRLKDGLISIIQVETDRDLTLSKVYYSVVGNNKFTLKEIDDALLSAKGFIKQNIKDKLRIRRLPDIRFIYTDSIKYAIEVEELLKRSK